LRWYVYIITCSDGTYYTGVTIDIDRRLNEHNTSTRGAKYTRTRRPVNLAYFEVHNNRSDAQVTEHKIKKMTRIQKEKLIGKHERKRNTENTR